MSKRVSLKQFQQDLSDRLQIATTQSTANSRLAIRVGTQNWLVDLADISEVISPSPFAEVPLTQAWFSGVTNIRGKLFSVIDLPGFAGLGTIQRNPDNRLMIVHPRFATNAALLVDQALGLRNIDKMQLETDNDHATWCTSVHRDEDGHIWHNLNMTALVTNPEFLAVGI
jgi:twitching motility protein PilI